MKFVLAVVVFILVGVMLNPMLGIVLPGYQVPPLAVLVCQLLAAGAVVKG